METHVKFQELKGSMECNFRRMHSGINMTTDKPPVVQKAIAEKEIVKKALDGLLPEAQIPDEVRKAFDAMDYKNAQQRELHISDCTEDILRAVKSIKNYVQMMNAVLVTSPATCDVPITTGTEQYVIEGVHPDLLVVTPQSVNAVSLRVGKPVRADGKTLDDKAALADKQLYALIKYAEKFVEDNAAVVQPDASCMGSYWFMRKGSDVRSSRPKDPNDPNSKPERVYDPDMFFNKNMKFTSNIVEVNELYHRQGGTDKGVTQKDLLFQSELQKYRNGLLQEECTEEQCANCLYNQICHYEQSVKALPTQASSKTLSCLHLSSTQEAITNFMNGYAVVNAVPGAGKTLVLCLRLVNLLLSGVKPKEIMIISFTHSAAEVFRERTQLINDDAGTGEDLSEMWATTFNAFGQKVLEDTYKRFGFSQPPRILQPVERSGIIAKMLNSHPDIEGLDYRNFEMDMPYCKGALTVASRVFQRIKERGYTIFDVDKLAKDVPNVPKTALEELCKMYSEYDQYLKDHGRLEYADQEMLLLQLLEEDPYYFDTYGIKHILVDEAQDTSENQFTILKHLTKSPSFESLMLVGDDSQSIYGFRNTNFEYFLNFEQTMGLPKGSTKFFYMVENYRSTPEIINFANELIKRNTVRVVKDIVPTRPSGKPVVVKGFCTNDEVYNEVLEQIKAKLASGTAAEDIAVIASTRTELLKMADLLTEAGIASIMLNPERLMENSRVQAGIAAAKYVQNPNDTQDILIALNAIFKGELFQMSDADINAAIAERQEDALKMRSLPEAEYREAFFKLLEALDDEDEIYEGFIDTLKGQPNMPAVFEYCNDFALFGDKEEKRREHNYAGVALTTAHSSKGMEWPVVFAIISKFASNDTTQSLTTQEEKRRLLYVAATRARDELEIVGLYVASGGAKDRRFNNYLVESLEASGKTFDPEVVNRELSALSKERSAKRKAEKEAFEQAIIAKIREAQKAAQAAAKAKADAQAKDATIAS